jgi:hypothetical protein
MEQARDWHGRLLPIPIEKRFWDKVKKTTSCWLWTGSTDWRYGSIWIDGRLVKAHRVAWELTYGPIPLGQLVLPRCDVTLCVRPDHLFLGTQHENLIDASRKGRSAAQRYPDRIGVHLRNWSQDHPERIRRGEQNNKAKLTSVKVREIRKAAAGGTNCSDLGRTYGVSRVAVANIVKRKVWRHV